MAVVVKLPWNCENKKKKKCDAKGCLKARGVSYVISPSQAVHPLLSVSHSPVLLTDSFTFQEWARHRTFVLEKTTLHCSDAANWRFTICWSNTSAPNLTSHQNIVPGANHIRPTKHSLADLTLMTAILSTSENAKGKRPPRKLAVISDSVNWKILMLWRLWPQTIEKANLWPMSTNENICHWPLCSLNVINVLNIEE